MKNELRKSNKHPGVSERIVEKIVAAQKFKDNNRELSRTEDQSTI